MIFRTYHDMISWIVYPAVIIALVAMAAYYIMEGNRLSNVCERKYGPHFQHRQVAMNVFEDPYSICIDPDTKEIRPL